MGIATVDQYVAAAKQIIPYTKTASVASIALNRFSVVQAAGNPGAGTLLGAATPAGGLLTDASSGMPLIDAFGGGAVGYLSRVRYTNTVACNMELWDKIYAVGITTAQLGTLQTLTLSSQPSILGRCPDGAGNGLRIFVEITTTMSATATTINVTYTNSAGTTGRTSTVTASLSGFTAGRWVAMPLQAGDSGVQKIESVIIGGATNAAGALNVIIARPLWGNRIPVANSGGVDGLDKLGWPIIYADSALALTVTADSTATGVPDLLLELANA